MSRAGILALGILAVLGGLGLGMFVATASSPAASGSLDPGHVANLGSARPSAAPSQGASPSAGEPSLEPSLTPSYPPLPTPTPKPSLVPAPLTGRLVTPAAAQRHPIAVMIDDLSPARAQSGFNAASIVWQAPAEGGIPRYMMVF